MKKHRKRPKARKWKFHLVFGFMADKKSITILINPAVYIAFSTGNPLIKSLQIGIVWIIFNIGIELSK